MPRLSSDLTGISSYLVTALVLLLNVFDLQYSILMGPVLDVLLLIGLGLLGLILAFLNVALHRKRKAASYGPFALLVLAFSFPLFRVTAGHRLHFLLNKDNLEQISRLSEAGGVYQLTDLLRNQKILNGAQLINEQEYTTPEQIGEAFGAYLRIVHISPRTVSELRQRLEDSDLISLSRTPQRLILLVDGMENAEYGYALTYGKGLAPGDTVNGLPVYRLINLGAGWYFFYSGK